METTSSTWSFVTLYYIEASIMSNKPSIFPNSKLPSDTWESGIRNLSEIENKTTREMVKVGLKKFLQRSNLWHENW